MRYILSSRSIILLALSVCCVVAFSTNASAQRRDFLTDEEIEIVRDAQDIDARIEVLTRMIDRRFTVLGINVNGWKDAAKTSDVWGELPKGSRPQLLNDIKRILQKAIDDIDNLYANPNAAPVRDKSDKAAKKDPQRFPAAVRTLAAAANRYLDPLRMELDKSTSDIERGSIMDSIEMCGQIVESVGKLPPPPTETKKTKN